MAELRWNPVLRQWIMVASHRQNRPQMPKDWCPFCIGSGKVPDDYDVYRYPNDFPALSKQPPEPDDVADGGLFQVAPSYGVCEVLLYSPDHHGTLSDLNRGHMRRVVEMWKSVYTDMKQDDRLQYCFIFENRGDAVGVTMPHPHGQAYGYPFIPDRIAQELESADLYHQEKKTCLFCDLLEAERRDGRRIIYENEYFTLFVPFSGNWTYGTEIRARRHVTDLGSMTDAELDALAEIVRRASGMYDSLFDGVRLPYMMCMHNAPLHMSDELEAAYHFGIEFMPPMRSATVQQFRASSESGAGAWCNPNCPEDKAAELREAMNRFLKNDESW